MLIKFDEITLEELLTVSVGRIDGDRGVLIIGKEALSMTITLEEAQRALEKALARQYEHECGYDMYYSSQQYKEDQEEINHWKEQIKKLKELRKA